MRLGVFGGTFDPIHMGHLMVAEEARVQLDLAQVLFVPAGQPYFKADSEITEAGHRMAMVELAVESNRFFHASDLEIKRSGPTYTLDTLLKLRVERGTNVSLYVILGLDSLAEMERWRQPERILDMSTVVGVPRPGSREVDAEKLDAIYPCASHRVVLLDGPLIGISGSEIRRRVSDGVSIRYLVPDAVGAYIYERRLYGARPEYQRSAGEQARG